jgi:hypothetical protein
MRPSGYAAYARHAWSRNRLPAVVTEARELPLDTAVAVLRYGADPEWNWPVAVDDGSILNT